MVGFCSFVVGFAYCGCFFVFLSQVSLCRAGWLRVLYVEEVEADLELIEISSSEYWH